MMNQKLKKCLCICLIGIPGLCGSQACGVVSDSDTQRINWTGAQLTFCDTFPARFRNVQAPLFQIDRFELVGKLMTLFLKDKKKGYVLQQSGDSLFSVKSRKTIQPGSRLRMVRLDMDSLVFTAHLVLKKGVEFPCEALVAIGYRDTGGITVCHSSIRYAVPGVIRGLNRSVAFFTGTDFVAWKITEFVRRFNFVIDQIAALDVREWRETATDKKRLSGLVFPVEFSGDEIECIAHALQKSGPAGSGNSRP
jgi:hypothetical protein